MDEGCDNMETESDGSENQLPVVQSYGEKDIRLGQVLVNLGKLNELQVRQALSAQANLGGSFGEVAIKLGFVSESDVEQALGYQYDYTILSGDDQKYSQELEVAFDPFGQQAELFRAIRSQLILNAVERGRRAVSVVSPSGKSGVSYIAANLAIAFAQQGLTTCLVDANLRTPVQNIIFGTSPLEGGLSDVLRDKTSLDDALNYDCFPGLGVLFAGPIPPNPQELLGRPAFVALISQLLREFDLVLFDTPATNRHADGRLVASKVGSALVVARKDKTHSQDVEALKREIEEDNGRVVGAILNDF